MTDLIIGFVVGFATTLVAMLIGAEIYDKGYREGKKGVE